MVELLCPEHRTPEAYQFTVRPDWHDPFSYLTRFDLTFGCGLNLGMVLSAVEQAELPVYPVTPSEWAALILSRWDRAFRPAEPPPMQACPHEELLEDSIRAGLTYDQFCQRADELPPCTT